MRILIALLWLGIIGMLVLIFASPSRAEQVVQIPRDEFVTMLGNVDHLKREHANLKEQVRLYVTLRKDHEQIIKLNKEHIQALEDSAAESAKIAELHDMELMEEKRLSRYKTYGFGLAVLLWLVY